MRWGWLATRQEPEAKAEKTESVRITFVVLTFAGGCLLLPPRQWISAGILIALSMVLGTIWRRDIGEWLFPPDPEPPKALPPPVPDPDDDEADEADRDLHDPDGALPGTRQSDAKGD